jgi:SAM-dependent methyltransferase
VSTGAQTGFEGWIDALDARYLADLRVPEITRALRALSSAYVERRGGRHQPVRATLDTAGKRAAFAVYYAPLHLLAVTAAVRALGLDRPPPGAILDLGCGTGVAGAAWALAAGGGAALSGIDRHPWAVTEARWTYARLGVRGRARQGDAARVILPRPGTSVIAAYLLNELPETARREAEERLLAAAARGGRVLVVEPIARAVTPWWDATAARFTAQGGRADQWRLEIDTPAQVAAFGRAAGLTQGEVRIRTLSL